MLVKPMCPQSYVSHNLQLVAYPLMLAILVLNYHPGGFDIYKNTRFISKKML